MFNPFNAFEPRFLSGFKQKGVKAFVQQTYERGKNLLEDEPQPAYLLIHFNDVNKAKEHFDAIKTDPGRNLFHVDDPNEWQQLQNLINRPSGQRFFTILTIKEVNEKARKYLDKKLHAFIDFKTNWHPRSYELVAFSLEVEFGKIFVSLKYGPKHEKVEFDELEKLSYVL